MKTTWAISRRLLLACVLLAACPGDQPSAEGSITGAGGVPGGSGSEGGALPEGGEGACWNEADFRAHQRFNEGEIGDLVEDCALDNWSNDGLGPDHAICIQRALGVSDACAECYDALSRCLVDTCSMCLADQSAECDACVAEHCSPEWKDCTGYKEQK